MVLCSRSTIPLVRGWPINFISPLSVQFAAHTLVRTTAGELLDVAFDRLAHAQIFIGHPPTAGEFVSLLENERPLTIIDVPIPLDVSIMLPDAADFFFLSPDEPNL